MIRKILFVSDNAEYVIGRWIDAEKAAWQEAAKKSVPSSLMRRVR